jgi:rSAM/selenodomain-associated transferase 1
VVGLPQANVLGVLTRAPSAGGKSRLFAALRRPCDPALLTALLLDTVDAADVPGVTRVVAVTPTDACEAVAGLLPSGVAVLPQRHGDLGQRMRALMQDLFDHGARRVVLIGSDLPALPSRCIAAAFTRLECQPDDLVLGPATDGGYYLIGGSRLPPVFDGIEWGSARVLAQTRDAADRAGLRVHLLEPLTDVDVVDDIRNLPSGAAPRTTQWARSNGIVSKRDNVTSDGVS